MAGLASLGAPSPEEQAVQVEPMLSAAGFQMLNAGTPEKQKQLQSLTPYQLAYYTRDDGKTRYWFADPTNCQCLFVGDLNAYRRYQDLRLQNQMIESQQQALMQQQMLQQQQMQMMSPFGFGGPFGGGPFGGGYGGSGFGFVF